MMPRGLLAQPGWEEGREAPGRALGASLGAQGNLALQRGAGTGLLGVIPAFLYQEGGQTLDRLPRELVDAPSLLVLQRHLDNALNNRLSVLVSPEVVRQLN